MVYQETPPVQDSGWISGWDSSADVGELLLAPVRPGGAVCPLLQIGLQRGEAQHGPETPQLRDARDALGKLTFLEKSLRFFLNCRIQILASCRCLWRNGRLMTSTDNKNDAAATSSQHLFPIGVHYAHVIIELQWMLQCCRNVRYCGCQLTVGPWCCHSVTLSRNVFILQTYIY